MADNFDTSFIDSSQNILHLIQNPGDFLDTFSIKTDSSLSIYDLNYFNYLVVANDTEL